MNETLELLEVEEQPVSESAQTTEKQLTTWSLDATHSHTGFSIKHLMISNVRGEFNEMVGTLSYDPLHVERSEVSVQIPVASIDTGDANRDAHLKNADFFDVEKYPEIAFRSTKWEQKSDDEILVTGDFTMHGVTREITLRAEPTAIVKDPWGGSRVGFSATAKINRKDYGLTWNAGLETGGVLVGEDVKLTIEAQFVKV